MKKIIISTVIILVVIILTALAFDWGRGSLELPDLNSNIAASSTNDMPVIVNNVKDNQEISNPLKIEGKAKGSWFFEATFPVELVDVDGTVIASTVAKADGDWMTNDFVNFTADLEYNKSTSTDHALLILSKDNPSGNPELDQSIYIPVVLR